MPVELDLIPADPLFATRLDLEREAGADNLRIYAGLNSNLSDEEIDANIEDARLFAADFINTRLRQAGYAVPLVAAPGGTVPAALLARVARKLAVWDLYQRRGMRDTDAVGTHWTEAYEWAVAELDRLIAEGLLGVVTPVDTATKPGTWQSVPITYGRCGPGDEFSRAL